MKKDQKHKRVIMSKKIINVAGVKLDQEHFPILYKWAQKRPETLERTLRGLNVASGANSKDLTPDAINLESDLQHDRYS